MLRIRPGLRCSNKRAGDMVGPSRKDGHPVARRPGVAQRLLEGEPMCTRLIGILGALVLLAACSSTPETPPGGPGGPQSLGGPRTRARRGVPAAQHGLEARAAAPGFLALSPSEITPQAQQTPAP